jgi:hypothetical protein
MAAGHDQLELAAAGRAEDADALGATERLAGVVLMLLLHALVQSSRLQRVL